MGTEALRLTQPYTLDAVTSVLDTAEDLLYTEQPRGWTSTTFIRPLCWVYVLNQQWSELV